ncbi:MAG: elongation factor P [Anaerolineae bacterium]|jgi:elongation factor P|nr:elongation factor P [Anaerolineae bacterium]
MIDVNQLRKGATFTRDGELYRVLDYKHIKTGRGNATIRVKVRNLRTSSLTEMSFSSGNSVEDIKVEARNVQFLYDDGEFLHFMDLDNYEQPQLRKDVFGDDFMYLKENMALKLNSFEGEIIDYELPSTMEYKVVETELAVAGDRANNPTKKIKLETGLEISAPMFINVDDTVRVNLDEGSYITRVNS